MIRNDVRPASGIPPHIDVIRADFSGDSFPASHRAHSTFTGKAGFSGEQPLCANIIALRGGEIPFAN